MEKILLQSVATVANLICLAWMYRKQNYKTAIFSAFGLGVCVAGLLLYL